MIQPRYGQRQPGDIVLRMPVDVIVEIVFTGATVVLVTSMAIFDWSNWMPRWMLIGVVGAVGITFGFTTARMFWMGARVLGRAIEKSSGDDHQAQ